MCKVSVIGLGYIGLPTALTMANAGYEVVGTDYNKELVKTLNDHHPMLVLEVYLILQGS